MSFLTIRHYEPKSVFRIHRKRLNALTINFHSYKEMEEWLYYK
jgi:hypothetical protein